MDDVDAGMMAANCADPNVFPWSDCLMQLTGGTTAGMAVGYTMKTALKMVMLVLGSVLMLLFLLSHAGFITVNWEAINCCLEDGTRMMGEMANNMFAQLSSSFVGFGAGAIGGWKMNKR